MVDEQIANALTEPDYYRKSSQNYRGPKSCGRKTVMSDLCLRVRVGSPQSEFDSQKSTRVLRIGATRALPPQSSDLLSNFCVPQPVPVSEHLPCTAVAVPEEDDAELQFNQEESQTGT